MSTSKQVQRVQGSTNKAITTVQTACIRGVEALPVTVEVSVYTGLPQLEIVGMPDAAVLEARSRVRCALRAAGFTIPRCHITVNLAPADYKKSGTSFDFPLAVGILLATHQIPDHIADKNLFVGELALDGRIVAVRGEIGYYFLAQQLGYTLVTSASSEDIVSASNFQNEAVCKSDVGASEQASPDRLYCAHLCDLKNFNMPFSFSPHMSFSSADRTNSSYQVPDYADIVDQDLPKRACVIAAAGSHNLLLIGPPGAGKTMLARSIPSILPPLDAKLQAETLLVHSVAGVRVGEIAEGIRPFRAPHHSISRAGLIGGGRPLVPGEISLAHGGVLFLDEFPEFDRASLQALRQPIEDGFVRLVRADGIYTLPAHFQLIAAANPCPCGYTGDPDKACTCTYTAIKQYQAKMGGPLMDRIDMVCDVARPSSTKVIRGVRSLSSKEMADQVSNAKNFSADRMRKQAKQYVQKTTRSPEKTSLASKDFSPKAQLLFEQSAKNLHLGARVITKVASVARTIADLDCSEHIQEEHVIEALSFRSRQL